MHTSLLVWLWTLRVCLAIPFDGRCKSVHKDRAECSNMNLGTLHTDRYPLNTPSLVYLDLDNNGLVILDADVFRRVTRQRTLILRNNMLHVLPYSLFSNLYDLEDLDLRSNRLVSLTDERLFMSQNSLTSLDLSYNQIITIHKQVLLPLHSIRSLKLAYNPFICDCELRSTMMWCELNDLDTLAMCGSPCVYSGLPWTVLRATDSCNHLQIPDFLNTTNDETIPEMKQNNFEITLLIAGMSAALILIWCSITGLYIWKKLSHRCRNGRKEIIYDEATSNEDYYYEDMKCYTHTKKEENKLPKMF